MRIWRLTFHHSLEGRHGYGPLKSPLGVGSASIVTEQQGELLVSMSEDGNPGSVIAHPIYLTRLL